MTNYSRSVLKSNGLHHSKNLPEKFSFSPKPVPTNIAKKLPPQRCSKPLFIPLFNFSHKRPTFAFTGESGHTLGFRRRIAHSGLHGETGAVSDGGAISTLGAFRTFRKPCVARCQNGKFCRFWGLGRGCSRRTQRACGTAMRLCASLFRGVAAPLGCVIFSVSVEIAACTPCAQCFLCVRGGGGITTPGVLCVLLKHSAPACQKGSFAAF